MLFPPQIGSQVLPRIGRAGLLPLQRAPTSMAPHCCPSVQAGGSFLWGPLYTWLPHFLPEHKPTTPHKEDLRLARSSRSRSPPGHAVLQVTQSSGSRGPLGHAVLRARPEVQVRTWLVRARWLHSAPPGVVSLAEEGLGVPKTPSWLPRGHAGDHSQGQEAARLVSLALQQTIRLMHP